jgi:hypothetical protein
MTQSEIAAEEAKKAEAAAKGRRRARKEKRIPIRKKQKRLAKPRTRRSQ